MKNLRTSSSSKIRRSRGGSDDVVSQPLNVPAALCLQIQSNIDTEFAKTP